MGKKHMPGIVAEHDTTAVLTRPRMDLRTQRTRMFVQNAFVDLAQRRGFDRVSVQAISEQAMINRTTFYRYYKDKYHLVEEVFKSALQRLATDLGPPLIVRGIDDLNRALADERITSAWAGLLEHFASNARMYHQVLVGKGSAWFQARMREDLMKFLKGRIVSRVEARDSDRIPSDAARCFYASAIVGFIYYWLTGSMKHSASQMAHWFRIVAYKGYLTTIAGLRS